MRIILSDGSILYCDEISFWDGKLIADSYREIPLDEIIRIESSEMP